MPRELRVGVFRLDLVQLMEDDADALQEPLQRSRTIECELFFALFHSVCIVEVLGVPG